MIGGIGHIVELYAFVLGKSKDSRGGSVNECQVFCLCGMEAMKDHAM